MKVIFLRPLDQFSGVDRLLQRLKLHLANDSYLHLRIAVAFAKVGPLLRLNEEFERWREKGKTIEAIFGIDLRGTSRQALEFALRNFDATYITHTTANAVFHPKFYLFEGNTLSLCLCGSHNLTVGPN
jgi:HKD family nuclease